MIHHRSRLTRHLLKEPLLITLAIQIRQEVVVQAFSIRLGEASLGLEIRVAKVMTHAAVQEVEAGGVVWRFTAAVVAPVERGRVLCLFRDQKGGERDREEEFVGGGHVSGRGRDRETGFDDVGGEVGEVRGSAADVGARGFDELDREVWNGGDTRVRLEDLDDVRGGVIGWRCCGGVRNDGGAGDAGKEKNESRKRKHFEGTVGGDFPEVCCLSAGC